MSLFPKVLWPFAITLSFWPWLRISPYSSLNVIYCLIITAWQWLMSFMPCIPMQIKPNKSPLRKGFWPFSFERSATFPPQANHVLVDLFSSVVARRTLRVECPPPRTEERDSTSWCQEWCTCTGVEGSVDNHIWSPSISVLCHHNLHPPSTCKMHSLLPLKSYPIKKLAPIFASCHPDQSKV